MSTFQVGDIVIDQEGDEETRLVVLEVNCGDAVDVYIESLDATVAEVNENYPPNDSVTMCVHVEWLDRHIGSDWEQWDADSFVANLDAFLETWSIPRQTYAYPESRLATPPGDSFSPEGPSVMDGQASLGDWTT